MIRVFLVDDHALVRSGLRLLLSAQPDLLIVGEAANGQELLAQLPTTPADVVLLDMQMPVMNGPETARQLRAQHPAVQVLALSMLDQEEYIWQMLDAGAKGYLLKSAGPEEISTGIRTVAAGGEFLSTTAGLAALHKLRTSLLPPTAPNSLAGGLSRREQEVLQLIASGLTTGEIADKLFVSKRTVETHRQNVLDKLNAKNTAALIRLAMSEGLIS
ncbi:MAG: response regulator transcription factor [Hymenobacter sp.]|nr:MAG: response regulator transcription factor [Hymenobacter sp.]